MSYIDKEKAIIAKLKSTDFEMFDGDAEDAYESIGTALDSFTNYANTVIHQQHMLPIYYARFEGQDLRDKIMSDDSRRKIAHDNAIAYVGFMNRLSDRLGLEPFADVDTNDRHEVARFIGDFVNETYNNGISGGMKKTIRKDFRTSMIDSGALWKNQRKDSNINGFYHH